MFCYLSKTMVSVTIIKSSSKSPDLSLILDSQQEINGVKLGHPWGKNTENFDSDCLN